MEIYGCELANATAELGGLIMASSWAEVQITDSSLTGGEAISGGAVYIAQKAVLSLHRTVVLRNHASRDGAAIALDGGSSVHATFSVFAWNEARYFGATVFGSLNTVVVLDSCTAHNNQAESGGVVAVIGGRFELTSCSLHHNVVTRNGGAIFVVKEDDFVSALTECAIDSNVAGKDGGAVAIDKGQLDINMCTFAGNHASGEGGTISASADSVRSWLWPCGCGPVVVVALWCRWVMLLPSTEYTRHRGYHQVDRNSECTFLCRGVAKLVSQH